MAAVYHVREEIAQRGACEPSLDVGDENDPGRGRWLQRRLQCNAPNIRTWRQTCEGGLPASLRPKARHVLAVVVGHIDLQT